MNAAQGAAQTTAQTLASLKSKGRAAFIPYITAGDPDLAATERFARALFEAGADILELGVPFSDPMADGPTNQRAAERALRNGTSLRDVIGLVKRLRSRSVAAPIVLFTYFNPVFRMGVEEFAREAGAAGVTAALTVDLPPEEAADYRRALSERGLETVFLASPTSSLERLQVISDASTGFVYYVARTGVTGVQAELSSTLEAELATARSRVSKPLAVGFGISRPEHARAVARAADGVVIGSALVKLIEENPDVEQALKKISDFAKTAAEAIRTARSP